MVAPAALTSGRPEQRPVCAADRAWARSLFALALLQLKAKYHRPGRRELFLGLRPRLRGQDAVPGYYTRLARRLGRPEDTLRREAVRLRKQFAIVIAQVLLAEVGPERLKEEWRNLFEILRQK